ncbi:hypothetical protein [Stieleria varia]|uniref:hypothetical protein n=1 Tax=Stieleria varia TaxID=2528005 RepID=UPI0011B4928F|nr:hypothetical protein [Stieleria varia]
MLQTDDGRFLRVDRPQLAAKVTDQVSMVHDQRPDNAADWLPDHAQDLIDRLREWSLELDAREIELQQRAGELERTARELRMIRSGGITAPKNDAPSFHAASRRA